MTTGHCVIVGAGHGADELVVDLRRDGWQGEITVIGEEPYPPYHRPPLSKTFLAEHLGPEALFIRDPSVYANGRITFRTGRRVTAVDRAARRVAIDDGSTLAWDKLVLATGTRPRRLALPGADLANIFTIRTITDIEAIRPNVKPGARAVIIGGGYIGLEAAAMLRKLGLEAVVLEAMQRVLQRVTAPEVSAFYERVHREEGVVIRTGVELARYTGTGRVDGVELAGGERFPADLVIVGIGVVPNVELAVEAGLPVDNGVLVDESCRTADPDILAIGDCTNFQSKLYGRRIRLESVPNAKEQARVVASVLCGKPMVYDAVPWFWSDQFDLKLQIAGLSQGYNEIALRGPTATGRSFAAFYLRGGEVIAVDAVNRGKEFMAGKRMISARKRLTVAQLADEAIPLNELMK